MTKDHPYYPVGLEIAGYHPPLRTFAQTTGLFFAVCGVLAVVAIAYSRSVKHFSTMEKFLFVWLVLTGSIHLVLEGGFAVMPEFGKDTTGNIMAELWKEYSKADSRYITRDSFIVGMESFTAFVWGPLALLSAYGMAKLSAWRYPLMLIVSMGQLYGDILYFVTCFLEGDIFSRPEPLYYWFYFMFMNNIWIVVPALVSLHAWNKIVGALAAAKGPAATTSGRTPTKKRN